MTNERTAPPQALWSVPVIVPMIALAPIGTGLALRRAVTERGR